MHEFDLRRRAVAEALGTALLLATVVGSGIMADRLTDDSAVALLANALATGAILFVVIGLLAPISGAHLNPAVSLVFALRREMNPREFAIYALAQFAGGAFGVMAAQAMFALPLVQASTAVRTGPSLWLSEVVATFGLVLVVLLGARFNRSAVPALVGLYITAAYWFTASTSFANPAATVARSLTDTFAGIRPPDVPAFLVAEIIGALLAMALAGWLLRPTSRKAPA